MGIAYWTRSSHRAVIPETRERNKGNPLTAPVFCLQANSTPWHRGGIQAEASALTELRKWRHRLGELEATGICRGEYQRGPEGLSENKTLQIFILVPFSHWLYANPGIHKVKLHEARQRRNARKLKDKQISRLKRFKPKKPT